MDDELKTIDKSFDNIPEEVKHFIYSKTFSESLEKMFLAEGLIKDQTIQLKGALYGYIAQLETEEGLLKTIHSVSKSIESSQRIIDWIKKEVTDKVLALVVDAYVENEDDETEEVEETKATSSAQTLSNLQDRLTKPSSVAPITRDYSVTRGPEPVIPKTDSVPKSPSMDIYREIPDN